MILEPSRELDERVCCALGIAPHDRGWIVKVYPPVSSDDGVAVREILPRIPLLMLTHDGHMFYGCTHDAPYCGNTPALALCAAALTMRGEQP